MTSKSVDTSSLKKSHSPSSISEPTNLTEVRFQDMIAEVQDYAIIILDPKGIVMTWNKGAERIKGYAAKDIIGKSFKIFYPVQDVQNGLPDLLIDTARNTGRADHEGWRIRNDGSRFWGNITITALHDNNGNITGFLKVTRDLTERKIAEDKYSNSLEELRIKNEELKQEEDRYHKMVTEIQDYAIILLDTSGKVLDWNKGAEKLKGYTPAEIIGKNFRLFYPQEDKETQLPQRLLAEALAKGSVNHEGYRVRKNGTRFWGNVAITALHDDDGKVIGFSKVTKDLTDRKIAEDKLGIFTQELQLKNEELKQSEQRYHRMISEVQDYAIILLDRHGNIQNWNAGAEIIKGYSSKEIIGKNFKLFYSDEDIAKGLPDRLLNEALTKGKATSEGWRKRKDQTKFWGSVVITALHDDEGNVVAFSKVTRDLTERKNSEDAVRKTALDMELKNLELERLNSELSSFSYVVSHDLKEPVRKIQVFANRQFEEDKSVEEIREFSRKIINTASRMQMMMESLLAYATLTNEALPRHSVDLNATLRDVMSDLEVVIADSGAVIKSESLPSIHGIAFQMHQLFLNLISNSIKFSHRDRTPRISITAKILSNGNVPEDLIIRNRQYHQITIEDNGIGFESDQVKKIFQVFERLQHKKDSSGTGVGLAIVKKVLENHEGLIKAESKVDSGSKFHIYLPVA